VVKNPEANLPRGIENPFYFFPFNNNSIEKVSGVTYKSYYGFPNKVFKYGPDRFNRPNSTLCLCKTVMDLQPTKKQMFDTAGTMSFWVRLDKLKVSPVYHELIKDLHGTFASVIQMTDDGSIEIHSYNRFLIRTEPLVKINKWYHIVLRWKDSDSQGELFLNNKKVASEAYYSEPEDIENFNIGFEEQEHYNAEAQ